MNTRYQKSQIEDVARILSGWVPLSLKDEGSDVRFMLENLVAEFTGLFAADNPEVCRYCGATEATAKVRCVGREGDPFHNFEGGFDCEKFLSVCGLKESK